MVPGQTAVPAGGAVPTGLPHWTEPPTGQVPAVLSREPEEGSGDAILPPSWREEDADWIAHEEEFDPAMFSGEHTTLGSLDETHGSDEERRPWEFDLGSVKPGAPSPGATAPGGAPVDPVTGPVEAAAPWVAAAGAERAAHGADPRGEATGERPMPATGAVAEGSTGDPSVSGEAAPGIHDADAPAESAPATEPADQDPADRDRPSGTPPVGRARRSGLRPSRLRAKRPDQAPVAAWRRDPRGLGHRRTGGRPTEGRRGRAGRRRPECRSCGGCRVRWPGRRAARRRARHRTGGGDTTTAVPTATACRRSLRRSPSGEPRPLRSSNGPYTPEVTGGGPPEPSGRREVAHRSRGAAPGIGVRVGTGIAVGVVALAAFKLGTVTSLILSLIVVTFAAGECFAVLRKVGYHPATLLGLAGTISLMVGAYAKGVAALPLVMVLITVFTLMWYLFGVERGSPVAGTAATLLTVGWVSLLGAYAGLLLSPSTFPNRHGIAFLLGAIIATVANDVGALVVGRWIGRRPLAPSISPNKTWEGLVGGAVVTIIVSTVAVGAIHPWSARNAALLGVVVAVVAPLGDLCESMLKRDLRLKDMGTLLPGHGGILDRVDALIFVLPATYYLVRALNIG